MPALLSESRSTPTPQNARYRTGMLFLLILLLSLGSAHAALTITGRVLDAEGDGIAGAEVTATLPPADFAATVLTAQDGTYTLEVDSPGIYTITVKKSGYLDLVREGVTAEGEGNGLPLDLRLRPSQEPTVVQGVEELNPNVFVVKLDTNEITRELERRGTDTQFLREFHARENYFGAIHGFPLRRLAVVRPQPLLADLHGTLYANHQNSALNARSFFTVGDLLPSRRNDYGATIGGPIHKESLSFHFAWSQIRETGYVNGNIQAPLADERSPRSEDPATNAVIAGLLKAFPDALPNLPLSKSRRQLNTNALRSIRSTAFSTRFDYRPREADQLAFEQRFLDSTEEPFQIVVGRNPVTLLQPQSFQLTHLHTFSPHTLSRLSINFGRLSVGLDVTKEYRNLLAPLGIQVVPEVTFGGDLTQLGPGSSYPRRRVENRFYLSPEISQMRGNHSLAAGFYVVRLQTNDLQSDNSRGNFAFTRNFGRSAVENFLLGRPTSFTITVGNLYRGFRNWEGAFYFHDTVRLSPRWTLSLGLRYELVTSPTEVNNLTSVPFRTDANNFAPQFGFAWNPGGGKTVVRGGYGISFSSIFPVLYQRARFNPPAVSVISVDNPDLLDPLRGIDLRAAARPRSALNLLSPDLVAPYSQLYNFGIERTVADNFLVRIGYIGSRTIKLPTRNVSNRARPVPGICQERAGIPYLWCETSTINLRRPDPRYLEVITVANRSIGYFDALQLSVDQRLTKGLVWNARYTFSKAIGTGDTSFNHIATGSHLSGMENDTTGDLRGLERWDTPHALTFGYRYEFPWFRRREGMRSLLLGGWRISGTTTLRSATPQHMHTGSDAPGFGNVDGVAGDRPNLLNPAILWKSLDHPDRVGNIFRPEYFDTNIPPGGRGNLGYQTFRNDGMHNWNFAAEKEFPIREAAEVQFRAEFINFFNHPHFDEVNHDIASENFATITNTANRGRLVQLLLRLRW